MSRRALVFAMLAVLMAMNVGCAKLMGNLRRDLDDSEPYAPPTVGGKWTERSQLDDDDNNGRYSAVGHSERSPASSQNYLSSGRGGWVNDEQADANRRDAYRRQGADEGEGGPAYSNTPNLAPPVKRMYKNGARATRADFVDEGSSEGSLWASDGQTNYYFTKNKVRGIGDIVTVIAEEGLLKDTSSEVARTLSSREREVEMVDAQERLRRQALGIDDSKPGQNAGAANRAPAAGPQAAAVAPNGDEIKTPQARPSDIDVSKSLQFKAGDAIMAEILDRYPNGNYKIRGTKRIPYRGGSRMVTLLGVVRGTDITEEDTVASGKLYEYRLEVVR